MSTKVADSAVSELEAFFLKRDAWATWTPTVTQLGAVTVTVNYARYAVLAQTALVQAKLTATGAGTAGNAIIIGGQPAGIQPANPTSTGLLGYIMIFDVGTGVYQGAMIPVGAADWRGISAGSANYIGITPNFGLVAGDVISFVAAYERA